MVKIRLQRHGRKRFPYYHIVAADIRSKRDGRIIEDLGRFSPTKEPSLVRLEEDRVVHWLKNGAQPTNAVRSILKEEGIMYRLHLERWGKSQEEIDETIANWKEDRKKGEKPAVTKSQRMKDQLKAEEQAYKKEQEERAKKEAEKARKEADKKAEEKAAEENEAESGEAEKSQPTEDKKEEKKEAEPGAADEGSDASKDDAAKEEEASDKTEESAGKDSEEEKK